MHILLMTLHLQLPGCHSLKEKRGRLRGLRDKFGQEAMLALCESAHPDNHQLAEWSIVAISHQRARAEQRLDQVAHYIDTYLDVVVLDIRREEL